MPVEAICASGGYTCASGGACASGGYTCASGDAGVMGGYLCQWRVPVIWEATCARVSHLCSGGACASGVACSSGGACACRLPVPEAIPVPVEVPVLVQWRGVVHVNDGQQGVGDHSTPGGWRGYQGQTQVLNMNHI